MALTYNQIQAITEKKFIPKLQDGVYKSRAFVARLTRPSQLMLLDGGEKIIQPIINSKPSSGGYYEDDDNLNSTATDNITAAEFNWKQLQEPIRISGLKMLQNNGDAAKLRLVASKVMIAEKQIRENLAIGIFSDGTAATGKLTTKQITGLGAILSESSTYGGIAVADFAEWVATVLDAAADRPVTLPLLQQLFGSLSEDDEKPTVAIMKQNVYDQVWNLFQPTQRIISEEMAGLGFSNILSFNGIPLIVDSHADDNTVYMLNENHVKLAVHRERNLKKQTMETLEANDSMLIRMLWAGNLVCSNRRFQGKLTEIEVAA